MVVVPATASAVGSGSSTGSGSAASAADGRAISAAAPPMRSSLRIPGFSFSPRWRREAMRTQSPDHSDSGPESSCRRPDPAKRARPFPAIENESSSPMMVTVTLEPVTNRTPDARRTRVALPRRRARAPTRPERPWRRPCGPSSTTIPRPGISPFTVSRPETVISPLPVACTRADGDARSPAADGRTGRVAEREGGDDEHERDGGHESPTHHSTSERGGGAHAGPRLGGGMLHRPDVGAEVRGVSGLRHSVRDV